jgi:hypothetical protein
MSSTNKPTFMDVIKDIFSAIIEISPWISIFFVFALLISIFTILLSIYYLYSIMDTIIQRMAITTPLNMDTLEFDAMLSTEFFKLSKYSMWLFIVLPLLSLLLLGIMGIVIVSLKSATPIPSMIKYTTWILVAHNVLILLGFSIFYFKARFQTNTVRSRINTFNNYVCSKLFRNNKFLNLLRNPQTDIISIVTKFGDALSNLPAKADKDQYAKAFYTLTLYYHYHKIGIRNPRIKGALEIFSPMNLLLNKCNPAGYLNRYGTYIEDISELIKQYLPKKIDSNNLLVKQGFDECYSWIIQTNNLANSLYPEDSLRPFLMLTFTNFTIQTISLLGLSYFVSDGERFRAIVDKVSTRAQLAVFGVGV